jgi:hypothetical protein
MYDYGMEAELRHGRTTSEILYQKPEQKSTLSFPSSLLPAWHADSQKRVLRKCLDTTAQFLFRHVDPFT